MSRTATALVVPELNGQFELQEIHLDAIKPDEALVEIHASGVCHTDIGCSHGMLGIQANAVLGHEGAGVILETGDAVAGFSKGDKVLLSFSHCETCEQCASGHPAYCLTFFPRNMGGKRPDGTVTMFSKDQSTPLQSPFFGQSSFASHALVHRSCLVKVPPETNLDLFCSLGCGVQTGAGAVMNTLDVKPGSSLAVFGVGAVGMAAIMAAKIRKAKTIIAIDIVPARLELATKLGATHTILSGKNGDDVVRQIQIICSPGALRYAVDCSGMKPVIETMVEALGTRGRAATVGACEVGTKVSIDVIGLLTAGKEYVGCAEGDSNPTTFIPELIKMHANGDLPLEELAAYYDYKDYQKAIDDTKSGKVIKAVLRWK